MCCEDGKWAKPGRKRRGFVLVFGKTQDCIVVASLKGTFGILAINVIPNCHDWHAIILPPGGEGGGPCVIFRHGFALAKGAISVTEQELVLTYAQNKKIGMAVGVHIKRISARNTASVANITSFELKCANATKKCYVAISACWRAKCGFKDLVAPFAAWSF